MNTVNSNASDRVNIFISHKTEDREAALHLKNLLNMLGSNRIDVFVSEDITIGADWKEELKKRIGESNVFVLLFTRSTDDWDWCLYEAGHFSAIDNGAIIVIRRENDDPPSQLTHIQTLEATPDKISGLLKKIFGESDIRGISSPPINLHYADNQEARMADAKKICKFFKGQKKKSRSYTKRMVMKIEQTGKNTLIEIPLDSKIEADPATLAMFKLDEPIQKGEHWTWGDIRRNVNSKNWLNSLQTAILNAYNSKTFDNIQTTLQTPKGQVFRPVLDRLEVDQEGIRHFYVLFVEQVTEGASVNAPEAQATLLSSLTLGSRFQWELCDNYIYQVDKWANEDLDENLSRLKATFDNIHREADFRKQVEFRRRETRDRLVWAFNTKEDQTEVDENLEKQITLKKDLLLGIDRKDIDQIKRCLRELQVLNMQLVIRVAGRYEEQLHEVPLEIVD